MTDKAWKACERRVAKYIGGERVPITGRQRGDVPDIEHNFLVPEVKYKNKMPAWIYDALNQAEAAQRRTSQMPCVILVEKGQKIGDALIVFRLGDARAHWL